MKVYRCWWCLNFLRSQGKDCGQKECIEKRRSGAWRKRKRRNSLDQKPKVVLPCQ